jgi:hypothetical protein
MRFADSARACSSTHHRDPDHELDDPSWFDRQADAWTSDMQPWERLEGSVAAFEKYPQ